MTPMLVVTVKQKVGAARPSSIPGDWTLKKSGWGWRHLEGRLDEKDLAKLWLILSRQYPDVTVIGVGDA